MQTRMYACKVACSLTSKMTCYPRKKMRRRSALSCVFLLLAACTAASSPVASFLQDKKAAVFVFLAPDCPLSQSYTLTLNNLAEDFEPKRVGFYCRVFHRRDIEPRWTSSSQPITWVSGRCWTLRQSSPITLGAKVQSATGPELGQHRTG